MLEIIIKQLLNGLTVGSVYALIALGYTMVYGIIKLINFAHGDIYMVGAFLGLIAATVLVKNFVVVLVFAMMGSAILGVLVEKVAYKPLRNSSRISALISAIGASIIISNTVVLINGPQREAYPKLFPNITFTVGDISVSLLQMFIILVSIGLMYGLYYIVHNTKMGIAMRAVSQNLNAARLMGINPDKVISFTFAIGSSLAAAAGVLVGTYYTAIDPMMGLLFGLKAFVAAVLGGIGSIPGAMFGGIVLGLAEVLGVAFISPSFRDAIAFGILIFILIVKPTGLFGSTAKEKV
ncbi:branched-chain amino acid ABC transporter permease [Deferribacter autotrophicus]|uniref:Branched-chain amino acid ABC transporter permease n=1 Tax=Deferribacter autotrophicus TaxID=500465 RepID=A0A5A8F5C8_9BACT|nr:branched-chain amino acid ABC transporter permease [Deferribacter autotrophicus]KAA0259222.1 branched-chain amino acid ABC transporter permease [Deferribacter autotrophicus]